MQIAQSRVLRFAIKLMKSDQNTVLKLEIRMLGKSLENKKTHSQVLKKFETIRFIVGIFTLFFLKLSFSSTSSKSI